LFYVIVDGSSVVVQYSKWETGHPWSYAHTTCVVVTKDNYWRSWDCRPKQKFVCQSLLSIMFVYITLQ